jgi:hypothetical protein
MVNEALHDLILLGRVMDEDKDQAGQSTHIRNNFTTYVNGGGESISSNIASSSSMYVKAEPILKNKVKVSELLNWASFGGCTNTSITNGVQLVSNGTAKPSGIYMDIQVEPGDVFMMRFAVTKKAGFAADHTIKIGSTNVNKLGSFYEYALPLQDDIGYVDHVIECLYRETIRLEIEILHNESTLTGGTVNFTYPEVCKMKTQDVNVISLNRDMKSRVNLLQAEVKNLTR